MGYPMIAIGDITSEELKVKKSKIQSFWPWSSKVSTFIYSKLMLSKSTPDTSAELIFCLLLELDLIVNFWLRTILLVNSSFILEISDNRHHSSLTPLQSQSASSRKKRAVHSGLRMYTFVHVLLLCHNETANAGEMLNAQIPRNPPDSSALPRQEPVLGDRSVQQAGESALK